MNGKLSSAACPTSLLRPPRWGRRGLAYPHWMALVVCPACQAKNRVGPIPKGTPRCGSCKSSLPWIVDAGEQDFAAQTQASVPVLVDFWAPWCRPCRMVSPALERLARKHASRLKLVKVNVDEAPGLAASHGAQSIPTLVLLSDGAEVDRVVGALPEAALEARLAPHL